MKNLSNTGKEIYKVMVEQGITAIDLANSMNCTRGFIYQVLHGRTLSIDMAKKLGEALNIDARSVYLRQFEDRFDNSED